MEGLNMPKRSKYSSYDPVVKALIAKTRRSDLFPNLKIPRTTALHWIKQGYDVSSPVIDSIAETLANSVKSEVELKKLLTEAAAIQKLLKDVFRILGNQLNYKHIDSKETRDQILHSVDTAKLRAKRKNCLAAIELSLSRYKRWKREKRGCGIQTSKNCPRFNVNQLTFKEIETMRDFVTSTKFAHFPIRSLHHYTKRESILFCSYSTWTKYIDEYGWLRPRKKRRKKHERIGIRAKKPNKIWHMDVSYFIFKDGTRAFIQAIIDNYSRYVLAWQILPSYDGAKTASLLRRALERSSGKKLNLIVDGGSENKGPGVKKLEDDGLIRKKIAQFEISFSNSIVEALFRSMKHNYLYHQEITSFKLLKRHVNFWFREYNEIIPHTSFSGETPLERFNQSRDVDAEIQIRVKHEEALQLRIKNNQMVFCKICKVA
jgi:putative transposase